MKTQNYIVSLLKKLGYSDEVIIDEFQAYYMTEKDNFFCIRIKYFYCLYKIMLRQKYIY